MEKSVQFTSRFPLELMAWLKERAEKHDRSVNGQLVRLVKEAKAKEESAIDK